MEKIFMLIQKGIQCPFFIRPERTPIPTESGVGRSGELHKMDERVL